MNKQNPIIADLRAHMDGLIHTHSDMLQREAAIWSELIGWALGDRTPVKKARFYGFRVSTRAQLEHARKVLDRIAALPST